MYIIYRSFPRTLNWSSIGNIILYLVWVMCWGLLCVPSATGAFRNGRGYSAAANSNCLERRSVGTGWSPSEASARVSAWLWVNRVSPCWAVSTRARRTWPPLAAAVWARRVFSCNVCDNIKLRIVYDTGTRPVIRYFKIRHLSSLLRQGY